MRIKIIKKNNKKILKMNFLKNIFSQTASKKEQIVNKNLERVLYFTLDKRKYLPIELTKELTCEQLHIQYHNKIADQIAKLSQSTKSLKSDYSFLIIDSTNLYTRIKLKQTDIPLNYITPTTDIFYLSLSNNELAPNPSFFENTPQNKIQNSYQKIMNIVNPEEIIREGELQKYSFRQKKFVPRTVLMDKDKLMLTMNYYKNGNNQNTNLWSVILFCDILTITKNTNEKDIKDKKYIFEIETFQNDILIFKAKNSSDQEGWIESISLLVKQTKENKYFNLYTTLTIDTAKEIYDKEINIIFSTLSIKGALALKYSRYLYFFYLKSQILTKIIDGFLLYEENIWKEEYVNAYINFREIMSDLAIDIIDIKTYVKKEHNKKNIKILEQNPLNMKEIVNIIIPYDKLILYQRIIKEIDTKLMKGNVYLNKNKESNEFFKQNMKINLLKESYDNLSKLLNEHYKQLMKNNKEYCYGLSKYLAVHFKRTNKFQFINLLTAQK